MSQVFKVIDCSQLYTIGEVILLNLTWQGFDCRTIFDEIMIIKLFVYFTDMGTQMKFNFFLLITLFISN